MFGYLQITLLPFFGSILRNVLAFGLLCCAFLGCLSEFCVHKRQGAGREGELLLKFVSPFAKYHVNVLNRSRSTYLILTMVSKTALQSRAASVFSICKSCLSRIYPSLRSCSPFFERNYSISFLTSSSRFLKRSISLCLRAVSTFMLSRFCFKLFSSLPVSFFSS